MKNFNIEKFCIIKPDEADVSFLPMLVRRKLSQIDKMVFSILNKLYNETIDNIIFSSQYGEFDRLNEIISQYQTDNMVSPIKFSASVHNYSPAAFSQMKKITNAYNAISAGNESLETGICTAIIQPDTKTCLCYADDIGIGLVIDTKKTGYEFIQKETNSENLEEFMKFINGEKDIWINALGELRRL